MALNLPDSARPAPARQLWRRLFLPFAVGYFFSYFLRNANAVIADDLRAQLGLSGADLGLLTGAYLGAFGLAQLPLGLLLDRYGPRRVEATLLLLAALGCLLFARGESLGALLGARALIGVGVSACLMASFASFARWYPAERQASLNGAVMVAGALGALCASSPLAALTGTLGWRSTFQVMAGVELLVALSIWLTPERARATDAAAPALRAQLAAVGSIFRSRAFWVFAPAGVFMIGGFMALQSLWAVPFLTHAQDMTLAQAAERMLISALGMLAGFATVALRAGHWVARGVRLERVLVLSFAVGLAALASICAGSDAGGSLWLLLGACYGLANLAYALLQQRFDLGLAGRVNTALNLMSFCGAFLVQWLFGMVLDWARASGMAAAPAHRAGMLALLCCQLAAAIWFWRGIGAIDGDKR